jgi:hypothetical protein
MRRPIVFISVALSIALAASLVVGWAASRTPKTKLKPVAKVQDKSSTQTRAIPEHWMYWHLFEHKVMLDKKAVELDRQGKNGSVFREHYKTSANLDDREAQILDRIAQETYDKVTAQDARAKKLIDEIRAMGRGGFDKPGELKPELIARLKAMQKERDEMVMAGVSSLRNEFGPAESTYFNLFVKERIGPSFKNVTQVSLPRDFDPRTDPRVQQMLKDLRRSK